MFSCLGFADSRTGPFPRNWTHSPGAASSIEATVSELDASERDRLLRLNAEIATLAGGLAHEVRNPLSTIQMNLELLAEDLEEASDPKLGRMRRKLETMRRECGRMEVILNAFLQFARAGEMQRTDTSLNQLVSEFVEFYRPEATASGIDVSPHLAADLPLVAIDAGLFRQVLSNLVRNSQQAMPDGGQLEIQTSTADGHVRLAVIDTGKGMDERARKKAFEPFFSTKANGSGLGLPTVRKIVEAHGGTIACESEVGHGTRFTIELPITTSAKSPLSQ
ncbi:MAG: two-component sensor histidine kinase [Planctomycetota bacterium]|nr:MAG: two-component sensor histidine kinase [Planctomycetota bacterium]